MFKREMFKRYDVLPEGDDYICYDPGVSEHGDPTAMHHWRVDDQARLYLVSRWYRRCTMDVWIAQLLKWVKDHKPIEAVTEAGTIRRAAEPFIQRAMRKARVFFSQSWVTRSANKPAMAQAALAMVNSGQVYVPNNSDGDTFVELCMKFPSTKDDHDVDAFANLCLRLEAIWEANPPRDEEEKRVIIDGSFGGEEMKVSQFMPPRFPKRKSRWQTR